MAKVTIILQDRIDEDGKAGLRISVESDPKFTDDRELYTIAQNWGLDIAAKILDEVEDIREVKDPEDENETRGDLN